MALLQKEWVVLEQNANNVEKRNKSREPFKKGGVESAKMR